MTAIRRFWVLTAVLAVAGVAPFVIFAGELPSPMASHWGIDGRPDGSMPAWGVALGMLGTLGLGVLIGALLRRPKEPSSTSAAMLAALGVLAAGLAWSTVLANRGAAHWEEAGSIGLVHVMGIILASALAAVAAHRWWSRHHPIPDHAPIDGADTPVIPVQPGEQVAWVGVAVVRWPLIIVGVSLLAAFFVPQHVGWILLLAALPAIVLTRAEARVSQSGVTVRLGPIRVRRIDLKEIAQAQVALIEPSDWGGWGWRLVPDGSALVLRRGEGIVVTYPNGRRFAVTVDDAATGAGLINGLLARGGGTT